MDFPVWANRILMILHSHRVTLLRTPLDFQTSFFVRHDLPHIFLDRSLGGVFGGRGFVATKPHIVSMAYRG